KLDVSKREECFALAERIEKEIGTVDILVNNAGIFRGGPVLDYPPDAARKLVEVNQLGMLWMMQAFIPGMLEQRSGHVVNMCSVAGKVGVSYMGPYCATKAAVIMMTDSIRLELYGKGIDFTIIDPYFVSTGMFTGGKPMFFTRWQTPEKVSKKTVNGVKKNYGEVCVPSTIVRGIAMIRSSCFPRLTDLALKIVREDRMMGGWKEDPRRSF
ncbi:MAG: SDR family NAD(P)-dependent oxidoreductase, partial [Actinobacteria bacterium]|nr:SDR family NAD(P)-dependent oxidoreductase [Actinomycetota bacterium]